MSTFFESITDDQQAFIERQHIFFVSTAPTQGRINLSPKGLDSFRILTPNRVAYVDLTGSGNETSAHLRDNGRITLMFCAFDGEPQILRLFGRGTVVNQASPDWDDLACQFPPYAGTRQIMVIEVEQSQKSCGMGIPLYTHQNDRKSLTDYWQKRDPQALRSFWQTRNTASIDGLAPYPLDESSDDSF